MVKQPYIEETEIIVHRRYNPVYGDDRLCRCGHRYYRHFDSHDDMIPVGCKYCGCFDFVEFVGDFQVIEEYVKTHAPGPYANLAFDRKRYESVHGLNPEQAQRIFQEHLLEKHYALSQQLLKRITDAGDF